MAKTFEARFPGVCPECDRRIHEGDDIAYIDEHDKPVHEGCMGKDAPYVYTAKAPRETPRCGTCGLLHNGEC